MPAYRTQVFYQRAINEKWTNVYHIFSTGVGNAASAAESEMVPVLRTLLDQTCTLVKLLVSDPITAAFVEVPVGLVGLGVGAGSLLPLFNSIKVIWPTAAGGRPDYKYLKGFLTEDLQTAGLINSGTVTDIQVAITGMQADMVAASAPLCSNSGDAWGTAVVQQAVQMRQMHRRRRRPVVVIDP